MYKTLNTFSGDKTYLQIQFYIIKVYETCFTYPVKGAKFIGGAPCC